MTDVLIYGPLRSMAGNGKAAFASQIYDEALGKFQSELNRNRLVYQEITASSTAALSLGYDYYVGTALGTFEFTLAANPSNGELSVIFTTGSSPAITITSDATIYTQEGFSIDANSTYEMNIKALNGSYYVVLVKMEAV